MARGVGPQGHVDGAGCDGGGLLSPTMMTMPPRARKMESPEVTMTIFEAQESVLTHVTMYTRVSLPNLQSSNSAHLSHTSEPSSALCTAIGRGSRTTQPLGAVVVFLGC